MQWYEVFGDEHSLQEVAAAALELLHAEDTSFSLPEWTKFNHLCTDNWKICLRPNKRMQDLWHEAQGS